MEEWGDLDARLERKKRVKLRRQQREHKKKQKENELLEKERLKRLRLCEEMAREDALSVAMMRFYKQQERLQRREKQREKDNMMYDQVASARRRAKQFGLPLETPGKSGKQRLDELQQRVATKEVALELAVQAKQRLDALPSKRNRVRRLLSSFFAASVREKLERAVAERRCDDIVHLLDPKIPGKRTNPSLLDHESGNGLTPLLCTIYTGRLALLRKLLELGASPNTETHDGLTPLLACVLADNVVGLHILVEFRVNLTYETRGRIQALHLAADKGRNTVLKALLRCGVGVDSANTDGRTALMQSAIAGHYETTRILLAFNADKTLTDRTGKTTIDWARQWGFEYLAVLLAAATPSKSLMVAVRDQEQQEADAPNELVKAAIQQQFKAPGTVAMEKALRDGNVPHILELLSTSDVGYGPNFESCDGEMPLLVVSKHGTFEDVIICLKKKCCAIQCNRHGVSSLMRAAHRGDLRIVELLILAGCSILQRDFQGNGALRYLHDNEHLDAVKLLLNRFNTCERATLTLSQPIEDVAKLRDSLSLAASPQQTVAVLPLQVRSDTDGGDEDRSIDEFDGSVSEQDTEANIERGKLSKWSTRRHFLRLNKTRGMTFEAERRKMWKYAERGRRNGLIAPLPSNPAGRLKFPPCDNCQGNRARKRCFACDQMLCDKCHSRLHELPHRRHHEYKELEPTLMVGAETVDEVVVNQEASLKGSIERSLSCVETMKQSLFGTPVRLQKPASDVEGEKYERKQRLMREKQIAQTQLYVPVAAAEHAANAGEGEIYTSPAQIELADLYIAQRKWTKARSVIVATRQVVEESLGFSHPTMLKIHIQDARIDQQSGDLVRSIETIRGALSTFECSLGADQKDLVTVQDLALHVLDGLTDYESAVELCKRIIRLRTISLSTSHPLTRQVQHQHDEFVSKLERRLMSQHDGLTLVQAVSSAEQAESHRLEEERRLHEFRTLLFDQQPLADYGTFLSFAKKEFADDMVYFWIAVEKAKTTIDEHEAKAFRAAVVAIFLAFIKSRRIKIITAVQRKKMKKLITTPGKRIPRSIFDEVQTLVFDLIYRRVYARYNDETQLMIGLGTARSTAGAPS